MYWEVIRNCMQGFLERHSDLPPHTPWVKLGYKTAEFMFWGYMCISRFLCQLTCQSADIMSSLCGLGVRVRVNNFFSKTTRPRDMLFFLKDTLSIEDEKLFQGMQICLFVCLLETLQGGYPHQKCENFNFLSQFSQ